MAPVALSTLVTLALASYAYAQETFPATPLASKTFSYPSGIPYQVDTEPHLIRGGQYGYNICNSTTQNQDSRCQTALINNIEDFCIWGPPEPDSVVGDHEGVMVAWCTKPTSGARLIPEGTLQGLQWINAPDYVALLGYIDQRRINIPEGDWGGELDPHGADLRGNPLGSLVYTNTWSGDNSTFDQVIEWHLFIGGNFFCFKACDPRGADDDRYCEHILDRIGCAYNVPNNAQNGTFEVCDGENQDFPGIYTVDGVEMTYSQPPESLGPITTMPYQPRVPATSNCVTYESESLFPELRTISAPHITPAPSETASGSSPTGSGSGNGSNPSRTNTAANSEDTNTEGNGASSLAISGLSLLGVVFSVALLS
ncbi:hypothetical protein AX16_009191 [Volvariella volvacea WC 439]|nr:hypothetical protein AX16_009191 [Volvariella volvacea WC 439]